MLFICMCICTQELRPWCARNGIVVDAAADASAVCSHDAVIKLIANELNQLAGTMKSYERPLKFAFLPEPFTQVYTHVSTYKHSTIS